MQGYLLIQLGTPAAYTYHSVRRYLQEFLLDFRLVVPRPPLWNFLVRGVIAPLRARRVARQYRKITANLEDNSLGDLPLVHFSRQFTQKATSFLQENERMVLCYQIGAGPSVEQGLRYLLEQGCNRIKVLTLYPQFSEATTIAAQDRLLGALAEVFPREEDWPAIEIVESFADLPAFINNLVDSCVQARTSEQETILFSFHGYPLARVLDGDPYKKQCQATVQAFVQEWEKRFLAIPPIAVSFQSRFGKDPWLSPSTEDELKKMAECANDRVIVLCPSFVADNLETLFEVDTELREVFWEAGGKSFKRLPCPNADENWAKGLVEFLREAKNAHPLQSKFANEWKTRWQS